MSSFSTINNRISLLQSIVKDEPLIEVSPSLNGISSALDQDVSASIYFGTGLTTPKKPSAGLPFDMLSMSLCAEKIRRALGFKYIYHHIADTHALSNSFINDEIVGELARNTVAALELMTKNFNLSNYKIMLSSNFDSSNEYQNILKNIHTDKNEYVRRELADVEWYRQELDVRLKIGWIIQSQETSLKFDERLFDREYLRIVNNGMSFIYLKAGQTFDKSRPKASPYIYTDGESRIVLKQDENVHGKFLEFNPSERILTHLQNIVNLFEEIVMPLKEKSLERKIQEIISKMFS